jgi:hypothetical protein
MREPKRLAHRQAERNKARAQKQWSRDEDEDLYASDHRVELDFEPFDYEGRLMASPVRVSTI